jgi:hypothetical protein
VNNLGHSIGSQVTNEIGVGRLLVLVIHTGQALDLSRPGLGVQSLPVCLLTLLQRCSDVDEEKVSSTLADDGTADSLSRASIRGGRSGNDSGAGFGEFRSDESDAEEVEVLVLWGST